MTTWTYDDGSTMSDDGGVIRSTDAPAGNLLSDLWNPSRQGMVGSADLKKGGAWESTVQSWGSALIGAYSANKQASNNFELAKLQLQAKGQNGVTYNEGQPTKGGTGGIAISGSTLLLLGAVALMAVFTKD